MRIVSGLARGRRLQAPRGTTTRPTSDRVREAVFSTLQSRIGSLDGTRVLDLYAGSGAMGLEALSRGAASVVFVESNRAVARTLTDNIDRVGLPGTEMVTANAAAFAKEAPDRARIDAAHYPFDLVLCDPPYALGAPRLREVLVDLVRSGWLKGECELLVERDARDDASPWPEGEVIRDSSSGHSRSQIATLDRRTYGDTALWYGRLVERLT
jgi:16S rRNA (guanine966-N2)-methyltransferase